MAALTIGLQNGTDLAEVTHRLGVIGRGSGVDEENRGKSG